MESGTGAGPESGGAEGVRRAGAEPPDVSKASAVSEPSAVSEGAGVPQASADSQTAAAPEASEGAEAATMSGTFRCAEAPDRPAGPDWAALPGGLLRLRRVVLVVVVLPLTAAAGVPLWLLAGAGWGLPGMLPPLLLGGWGWWLLGRNWRSWRYAERADDLLITRGVLWRRLTVVPYGRMQLVEVTSGPLERHFGLASVQLHTAAAASDARIPGLLPAEAERLRDRLSELGQVRSAGL